MKRFFWKSVVVGALLGAASQAPAEFIYWTDKNSNKPSGGGDIQRAFVDDSGPTPVVSGQTILVSKLNTPVGIRLDAADGTMYWADQAALLPIAGDIRRANLDGSNPKTLLTSNGPIGVELDLGGGKLYFTDGASKIARANLDGTGQRTLVSPPAPDKLALDLAGGKMYWTDNPGGFSGAAIGSIRRANLDGTGASILIPKVTSDTGIALDLPDGKIYWSETKVDVPNGGDIQRANLDGTGRETFIGGLPGPVGIAFDFDARKIYWTDIGTIANKYTDGQIRRANLDGSDQEILVKGLNQPVDLALAVPEPSILPLLSLGAVWLLSRRRSRSVCGRSCGRVGEKSCPTFASVRAISLRVTMGLMPEVRHG